MNRADLPFLSTKRAVQSWYAACRSRDLKPGSALTVPLLHERIVVYRSESGQVHALDARCPHMGADLGQGEVRKDRLYCSFHRWSFGPDGTGDRRRAKCTAYPCQERYGLVWFFNGPAPLFDIPQLPDGDAVHMKPSTLNAHPHLLAANGLDTAHFESVHGLSFTKPPALKADDYRMQAELSIDLKKPGFLFRLLRLAAGPVVRAQFTTHGGNLATIHCQAGIIPVYVLFTHRPLPTGASASRTLFIFPRPRRLLPLEALRRLLAFCVMYAILRDDVRLLAGVQFRPEGLERGEPLERFIAHVNRMKTFAASD